VRRIQLIEKDVESLRKEQRAIEAAADKAAKTQATSSPVVKYCVVCDLNFYQEESKHISSKLHVVSNHLIYQTF